MKACPEIGSAPRKHRFFPPVKSRDRGRWSWDVYVGARVSPRVLEQGGACGTCIIVCLTGLRNFIIRRFSINPPSPVGLRAMHSESFDRRSSVRNRKSFSFSLPREWERERQRSFKFLTLRKFVSQRRRWKFWDLEKFRQKCASFERMRNPAISWIEGSKVPIIWNFKTREYIP